MKNLINALTEKGLERMENGTEIDVVVTIACKDIHLSNLHELTLVAIKETEDTLELIPESNMAFSIGKNYDNIEYDECENEYTIKYNNNIILSITII